MSDLVCNITLESPLTINVGTSPATLTDYVTTGVKATGVDAGVIGTISITDDYLYVCVTGGIAGVAIWKKSLLFAT